MKKNKELLQAAAPRTPRAQLLRAIVDEAERSVRFIDDPCLKLAAFEKNLDTLLAERFEKASKASARQRPQTQPSDGKG